MARGGEPGEQKLWQIYCKFLPPLNILNILNVHLVFHRVPHQSSRPDIFGISGFPAFECTKDKKLLGGEYLRWLLPLQSKWKSASSPFLFETFLKSTLIFNIANISRNESQPAKSASFILHKLWKMDKSWFEIILVKVFENIWYCWGSKWEKGQNTLSVLIMLYFRISCQREERRNTCVYIYIGIRLHQVAKKENSAAYLPPASRCEGSAGTGSIPNLVGIFSNFKISSIAAMRK